MIDLDTIWRFALCALAVWLVAHLLDGEYGPWNLMERLRTRIGSGGLGRFLGCYCCLSMLFSLPAAIWLRGGLPWFLIQWLALSAVSCLLERATQGARRRLVRQPISNSYLDKVIHGA